MIKRGNENFFEKEEKLLSAQGISAIAGLNSMYEERKVGKHSEEWRFVEFHLKSSLTQEVDIKSVVTISNQHMIINFEKRARNKLYTYAWYNCRNITDDSNSIAKLRLRGFEIIPEQGMNFIVGSLIDESSEEGNLNEESSYVLCKIIIGRSWCKIQSNKDAFSNYNLDQAFKKTRPSGYDSIMFCPADSMTNKNSRTGWGGSKSFLYRIFDSTNVLPMYWVTFSLGDSSIQALSTKHICGECGEKEADFYCNNCEEYICSSCFDLIHGETNGDKNLKEIFSHSKEPLKTKIKTGKCVFDPDKDVEFYCQVCKLTICSYCKVIGSHSKGEAANHPLQDIAIAYGNLAPDTLEAIKLSEDRRKKALEFLKNAKEQIHLLKHTNYDKAMKEITNAFEEESRDLQSLSVQSILSHLSVMNELLVIKDSINWLHQYFNARESFLKENNNKAEFVWVWNHHSRMVHEVMHNKSLVNTDYKIEQKDFEFVKMNEVKIINYRFEESSSFKEQTKEDNTKKAREGKKGVFDISQKNHNKKLLSITSKKKGIVNDILIFLFYFCNQFFL